MSIEITTSFVDQFRANLEMLVQQKGSKLRGLVSMDTVKGKSAFYDQIGAVAASIKGTRHADTPQADTPHSRRRLDLATYNWGDLIDNDDKVRMLIDPASDYSKAGAMAMGRAIDAVIVDAALGTAKTGASGSTNVVLPSSQKIAHGGAGLTLAKLLNAKEIFDSKDVPEEDRFMIVTAKQMSDLLGDQQITSADYNTVKALVAGTVDSFLGFKFIGVNGLRGANDPILPVSSNVRKCLAFQRNGIKLGIGEDITARITERDDKCYATQVYYEMSLGATRMQEEMVVEVSCQE